MTVLDLPTRIESSDYGFTALALQLTIAADEMSATALEYAPATSAP